MHLDYILHVPIEKATNANEDEQKPDDKKKERKKKKDKKPKKEKKGEYSSELTQGRLDGNMTYTM